MAIAAAGGTAPTLLPPIRSLLLSRGQTTLVLRLRVSRERAAQHLVARLSSRRRHLRLNLLYLIFQGALACVLEKWLLDLRLLPSLRRYLLSLYVRRNHNTPATVVPLRRFGLGQRMVAVQGLCQLFLVGREGRRAAQILAVGLNNDGNAGVPRDVQVLSDIHLSAENLLSLLLRLDLVGHPLRALTLCEMRFALACTLYGGQLAWCLVVWVTQTLTRIRIRGVFFT